jgi:hypothetical protein
MPSRSLRFLVVLVAILVGFIAGRMWPNPEDGTLLPPVRPSQQDEIDLLEREVGVLLAERQTLRSEVRDLSNRAPKDATPATASTADPAVVAWVASAGSSKGKKAGGTAAPIRNGTTLVWNKGPKNGFANLTVKGRLAVQYSTTYQTYAITQLEAKPAARQPSREEAAKLNAARSQLARLSSAVSRFTRERKRSPGSLHELTLDWTGRPKGYLKGKKVPLDPWGGRYELRTTRTGAVRVVTAGPDGVFGTGDDLSR